MLEHLIDAIAMTFLMQCLKAPSRLVLHPLQLLGLGLVGLHFLLIARITGNLDQGVLSLLFWGAIISQTGRSLPLQPPPDRYARGLGGIIIGLLLAKATHLQATETAFVRLFPLLAFSGWSLLVRGWHQASWGRIWALVVALSVPPRAVPSFLESTWGYPIRVITAACAAFGLHYIGFDVVQQGSLIQLPNGAVEVEFACTGAALLGLLLQISVLMAAMTEWQRLPGLVGRSVAIALFLSIIRVALMAAVVDQPATFQFWHGSDGGQIVTAIALVGLNLGSSYAARAYRSTE
ncbi:MAG: exosortase/archaeosortase family protein [Synechococcales bacterium]|nr:exosortase/archaeosortase family protein [Synechococcales bacterium]